MIFTCQFIFYLCQFIRLLTASLPFSVEISSDKARIIIFPLFLPKPRNIPGNWLDVDIRDYVGCRSPGIPVKPLFVLCLKALIYLSLFYVFHNEFYRTQYWKSVKKNWKCKIFSISEIWIAIWEWFALKEENTGI